MTTWTNISKASGTTWTAISKPSTAMTQVAGTPIGLLLSLTYATSVGGTAWTNIIKAANTVWTNIAKAT